MKVYVRPPRTMSRAMFRVAFALSRYAPSWVEIVNDRDRCDFAVEHVIGTDAITHHFDKPFAMIQYCDGPQNPFFDPDRWAPLWLKAELTWSYYKLRPYMPPGAVFYQAPMGVDEVFVRAARTGSNGARRIVLTSGYVTGPGAEAIEEVAVAASQCGLKVIHIGPRPEGWKGDYPPDWVSVINVSDAGLADYYLKAAWVSGLRHIEGFEMPALEGLVCGARPILFDRPDMRQWYNGHGVFVPECEGDALVQHLIDVFSSAPTKVPMGEREHLISRFSWKTIVEGFWTVLARTFHPVVAACDTGPDVPGGGAI